MKVWADTRLVIKQPCVCVWVCVVGFEITASHKNVFLSLSLSCEPNLEIFSWMELAVCMSGWALSVTGRYFCRKGLLSTQTAVLLVSALSECEQVFRFIKRIWENYISVYLNKNKFCNCERCACARTKHYPRRGGEINLDESGCGPNITLSTAILQWEFTLLTWIDDQRSTFWLF